MTTFLCAIAPLDQSATSLGWLPGQYYRDPCPALDTCGWTDNSLQFLADPGTPVVAPFPVTVVSVSPFVVRPAFPLSSFFNGLPSMIRIDGVSPAAPASAALDKGALLGRIAPGQRGTKWALWDGRAQAQFILQLFREVGLEPVGATRPDARGFRLTPMFGGHLLATSGGPAGAACAPSGGVHGLRGLEKYFLSGGLATGIAPPGYIEPSSGPYARYGTSSQTDTSTPNPSHENISPAAAGAGAGAVLLVAAVLGAWWYSRS